MLRCGQYNMHIAVDQHRNAAFQKVCGRLYIKSIEAPVTQHPFFCNLRRYIYRLFRFDDLRWRVYVVKQGIVVGKSFGGKQLFGIKAAIRLAKLSVAFMRNLT